VPYQPPSYILGRSASADPRDSWAAPNFSKKYDADHILAKRMGVTTDQVRREQALKRLGLREEDLRVANDILSRQRGFQTAGTKEEQLTGYTSEQLHRRKALDVLGITEEIVDEELAKELGSLGIGGRKRSFPSQESPSVEHSRLPLYEREYLRKLYNATRVAKRQEQQVPRPTRSASSADETMPAERRSSLKTILRELLGVGTFGKRLSRSSFVLNTCSVLRRRPAVVRRAVVAVSSYYGQTARIGG
jgi:hypothetical protein